MTLTQRLTRAGATFIVFGVAAAVLPQQNGAAQATTESGTCGSTTVQYRLTANADGIDSGTTQAVTSGQPVTLYSFYSTGGSFMTAKPTTTYSYSGTTSSPFTSPGASTTGKPTSSGTVTANVDAYGSTHLVTYGITVQ